MAVAILVQSLGSLSPMKWLCLVGKVITFVPGLERLTLKAKNVFPLDLSQWM